MELILHGYLTRDGDGNIAIAGKIRESISELIMNYFSYENIDEDLGGKRTTIPNANLRIWFSDEPCTLEEAQMNFDCYMETGDLFTHGYYVGYSEWTITGFEIDTLTLGGHDLNRELEDHIGQYIHLILTD